METSSAQFQTSINMMGTSAGPNMSFALSVGDRSDISLGAFNSLEFEGVRIATDCKSSQSEAQSRTQEREPAFRVSDRSGTPQAGNPAEEYSGERDPEALRGGTSNTSTSSV